MQKTLKTLKTPLRVGSLVEGEIIKIKRSEIWVDLGGVAMGIIRGPELEDELGEGKNLKVGDRVSATIIEKENEKGVIELSLRHASHFKAWLKLKEIKEKKETVKVKILEANKGGLIVTYGKIHGFIPASQLSSDNYPQVDDGNKEKILSILKNLIGKSLEVKIIDAIESEKKVIFSEKEIEVEKKKSLFSKHNLNEIIEGRVAGLSPFGVFVEFGDGLKGLVHISELSWQRIEKISDLVKIGQKIKVKIISFDNSKISLSVKRLGHDPWENIEEKYKIGDKVKGKINKITPYGIFVELEKNIQGLAHISEVPKELLEKKEADLNQELEFKIISLEPKDHRLGLSLKP